jgi:hypothetical protein
MLIMHHGLTSITAFHSDKYRGDVIICVSPPLRIRKIWPRKVTTRLQVPAFNACLGTGFGEFRERVRKYEGPGF